MALPPKDELGKEWWQSVQKELLKKPQAFADVFQQRPYPDFTELELRAVRDLGKSLVKVRSSAVDFSDAMAKANGAFQNLGGTVTGRWSSTQKNLAGIAGLSANVLITDDVVNDDNPNEAARRRQDMTMDISTTKRAVEAYMASDIPCFLWGAPGVGKSDAVKQIATEQKLGFVDFRALLCDPTDIKGLPRADATKGLSVWLPPSEMPQEKRDGKTGILFLDELNAAPASVQAACFGLVLNRRVGDYKLPSGWRVVAAGNRQSDKAAAQRMPTALANRFAHIDVVPTPEDFANWANKNEVHSTVIAFIRYRPALLHAMDKSDGRTFPTPRAWASVSKLMYGNVHQDFRMRLVSGIIGEAAAGEFEAFLRIYSRLPSLDQILDNPRGIDMPTEPAALFAIASGLSRKVTQRTFGKAITFMKRAPKELEVMFAVDAAKRSAEIQHTREFIEWATSNGKVIS